jgi:hypothetical protein
MVAVITNYIIAVNFPSFPVVALYPVFCIKFPDGNVQGVEQVT